MSTAAWKRCCADWQTPLEHMDSLPEDIRSQILVVAYPTQRDGRLYKEGHGDADSQSASPDAF